MKLLLAGLFGFLAIIGTIMLARQAPITQDGEMRLFLKSPSPKEEMLDKRIEEAFLKYIPKYEKNYQDQHEYFRRKAIFQENYKKIMEHNAEKEGFSVDVNRFTDWTPEEFSNIFGTKFVDMEPLDLKVAYDPNANVELE